MLLAMTPHLLSWRAQRSNLGALNITWPVEIASSPRTKSAGPRNDTLFIVIASAAKQSRAPDITWRVEIASSRRSSQ
jgi:hypothetical protein